MAQDTRKALDDKTRKLTRGKIEDGKEHAAYQESQQQLLAIQAEQQQNLAVARAESKASFENNQTLAQAAELGAVSAMEAEQAAAMGAQAGVQLNPATQQILSKYGAGQPRFSRSQSHSQQVTKQNITINNNITSNTTNDVKVPANVGGPLQGRPLQFKDPSTASGGSVGKFKTWISAAFARQNEEGAKRDREYRHRESSLTKSANRMMKKLEDIGKTIGSRMDPRKIGSTWQSQLKTLLLLFGFGYLTSNWTKILDTVASIEKWVKKTWGYFTGEGEGNDKRSFISDIKSFFGGNDNETFLQVFGKLIGKEGLFGYIKEYFDKLYQDRAQAVKEVKFPKIDTNSIFNTLESLSEYLGDLFGAIVGGTESVKKTVAKQAEKKAFGNAMKNYMDHGRTATTETTKVGEFEGDKGALSLLDGSYKGLTAYSVDKEGNLDKTNLTEATLAASSEATRVKELINSGDLSQTASLVQQLNRLYNTARGTRNNYVAVTKEFIDALSREELQDLMSRKLIQKTRYRVVYHKKTKDDLDNRENLDPTMRAADMYATQTAAYNLGGRLGSFATENYASAIFGDYGAPISAITEYGLTALERYLANDGRFILVRDGEKLKPGDRDTGETRDLFEISPDGIKMITNKLSNRGLDEDIDMENKAALQEAINNKTVKEQAAEVNRVREKTKKKLEEVNSGPADVQANSMRQYHLENNLRKLDEVEEQIYNNAQGGYVDAGNTLTRLTEGLERINTEFDRNTQGNRAVTFARNVNNKINQAIDYTLSLSDEYFGTNLRNMMKKYKHVRDYVNKVRPLFVSILRSKGYIKPEDVEKYADLLTAQSALESDWGRSQLSKYNNLSGMTKGTTNNSSGETKLNGNPLTFATFNSVEDWANEYIEYLNRKWRAFDKGPEGFLNQLEHSTIHKGQSYSGGNKNYISEINDILGGIRSGFSDQEASEVAMRAVEASKSGKFYSNSYGRYVYLDENKKTLGKGVVRTGKNAQYKGLCTSGPGTWYEEATGIKIGNWWNTGNPATATETTITRKGFSEIWAGSANDARENRMANLLQPGDVMVSYGNHKDGSPSAHAQMWDGDKWLSDTIQNSTFVFNSGRMGNRSAVLYRYGGQGSYYNGDNSRGSSDDNGKPKVEQKSFLQILRDKITEFITSFGGILDTADDKLEQAYSSISEKINPTDKFDGNITKEFTSFSEYLEHQDSLPNGLPPGMTYEAWKLKVQNLTGQTPDKLELNPESNKILAQYIEKPNLPEIPIPKEKPAQTASVNKIPAEPVTITPKNDEDLLSIFDPKSHQSYTLTFQDISNGIDEMNEKMNTFIELSAINGNTSAEIVAAVDRGTAVQASSSRTVAQVTQSKSKNKTRETPSLKTWSWDKGTFN